MSVHAGAAHCSAPLFRLAAHSGPVAALAVLPDSGALVSGGPDGRLAFWDYVSQKRVHAVQHEDAMACLAPRADRAEVLVGTRQGNVLRFPVPDRAQVCARAHSALQRSRQLAAPRGLVNKVTSQLHGIDAPGRARARSRACALQAPEALQADVTHLHLDGGDRKLDCEADVASDAPPSDAAARRLPDLAPAPDVLESSNASAAASGACTAVSVPQSDGAQSSCAGQLPRAPPAPLPGCVLDLKLKMSASMLQSAGRDVPHRGESHGGAGP